MVIPLRFFGYPAKKTTFRCQVPRQAVQGSKGSTPFFGFPFDTCQKSFSRQAVRSLKVLWLSRQPKTTFRCQVPRQAVRSRPGCESVWSKGSTFFSASRSTLVRNFFPPGCSVVGQKRSNVFDDFSRQAVYLS